MNPQKNKIVIVGAVAVVVLIFVLVFQGILPGLQGRDGNPRDVTGELTIWSVGDTSGAYEAAIKAFREKYKKVSVVHTGFGRVEDYEPALLDALASGTGPDIFVIPNIAIARYKNKITPAPSSVITLSGLRRNFPKVVEKDFAEGTSVYALPVSIDTLGLIYNRNIFSQNAIVFPPETWEETETVSARLTRRDEKGGITRSGAGLGGSEKTIHRAADIVALMNIQEGGEPMSGIRLPWYLRFSDPTGSGYAWNENSEFSIDSFESGKTAMIIDYASTFNRVKSRAGLVDAHTAPVPQAKIDDGAVTLARYWGYGVSAQAKNPALAWEFILHLTTNPGIAQTYLGITGTPPALNTLIQNSLDDPDLGVFARGALVATSITEAEEKEIRTAIETAIEKRK